MLSHSVVSDSLQPFRLSGNSKCHSSLEKSLGCSWAGQDESTHCRGMLNLELTQPMSHLRDAALDNVPGYDRCMMSVRGTQEGTVARSCLCNPMGCTPPGFPVHWIPQARVLEWVAIPFSRGSSRPGDGTRISCVSCPAGGFFSCWSRRWTRRAFDNSLHATEQLNGSWFFCCCCFF